MRKIITFQIQSIVISDVKFQAPSEETLSADEVVSLLLDDNELNSSRGKVVKFVMSLLP